MAITGATVNDQFYTELLSLTREELATQDVVDNVLTRNPSLELFKENGKSMSGAFLSANISTKRQGRTQRATDKAGTYNTGVDDDLTGRAVFYVPHFTITPCRINQYDLQINKGKNQLVDLAKFHLGQAKEDLAQDTAEVIHADVRELASGGSTYDGDTTSPPTQAFSLDALCGGYNQTYVAASDTWTLSADSYDDDPATDASVTAFTFGGISVDSTTHFWQATRTTASPTSGDASYLPIVDHMRYVIDEIFANTKTMPTHLIVSRSVWSEYRASFDDNKRFPDPVDSTGDHEFPEYQFEGLPINVRFDPDIDETNGGRFYLLTKDRLEFRWINDLWMKVWDADQIEGTLDKITPIVSQYLIGTTERRAHGVGIRVSE